MKKRLLIRICLPAAILVSGTAAGVLTEKAAGDDTTPPITVTATTPSVPTPSPLPAPTPAPAPAPKPKPVQRSHPPAPAAARPAAPTPAASTPSASPSTGSAPAAAHTTPATHASTSVTHRRPPRPHSPVRHRTPARAHRTTPKQGSTAKSPTRVTEPPTSAASRTHSQLLFFVLTAILLAIGAATVVGAPRFRARWAGGAARRPRRRTPEVREVIAELVHTPVVPPAPAALAPPVVQAPREVAEQEPVFEPESLLPQHEESAAAPESAAGELVEEEAVLREEAVLPTEEFCQISVWRGYAKSRFYARLEIPAEDDDFAVAESPTFRMRGNGTPDRTEAAAAAHGALLNMLREEGWEVQGEAHPWYAARLRRAVSDSTEASPVVTT
jgi:hypothetical protein